MGLLAKLKIYLKIRKPLKKLVEHFKTIKRGGKTPEFWMVLFGYAVTITAAVSGYLSPEVSLIVSTVLAALYNVFRGAVKSKEKGVRKWYTTTEFWVGVGAQAQIAFLAVQQGGINEQWIVASLAIINGAMVAARDLSHKQPNEKKK